MAVLPTRILEVEFDAGVWTNITADLVSLSTRRGRNKESGAFETGQMVFTVRNDGRKYDPDNTGGPYYGKLRPNRRVRFKATYSAVTYPVFQGYIDRIGQVYGGPNDATAEFQASDLFKILNRVELPRSVYETEVSADTPRSWFHLDEPAGATTVTDAVTGARGEVVGAVVFGQAGLVTRDPGTAMQTPATAAAAVRTGISLPVTSTVAPTGTGDFSVEFIILTTQAALGSAIPILVQGASSPAEKFVVQLTEPLSPPFTRLMIQVSSTHAGATTFGSANTMINDGSAHHVVVTRTSGVGRVYVDGVLDSSTFTLAADLRPDVLFGSPGSNLAFDWSLAGATLDELAFYNAALAAGQVATHYAARRVGGQWDGDLPGQRLDRILDLAEVPAGDRDIDDGTTYLQSTDLGGSALAYAQKIEETELGWLFVTASGKVRFFGFEQGQTDYLTSTATLVDDDSGAGLPYRHVSADVDEARIVTRATVSREGSIAVTWEDAAAITEFQIIDETHDGLLHDDDTVSLSYAQWIVNTHKAPSTRVGTVTLELTRDPAAMYPGILALELAARGTYKRKPQNTGAVISIDMRVEAISHATGADYWRADLLLSPFNLAGGGTGLPVVIWGTTTWDNHVWGHGDAV